VEGKIVGEGDNQQYFLDGREVSAEEFFEAFPEQPLGDHAGNALVSFKTLRSEALAVHPDQVPEARDDAARKGIPTEFDRIGRPIFHSSRHFREYAKKYGFRHRGY
jgi:hypothetical protein